MTMTDRFPQTTTAARLAEAFSGGEQIENGMPSRITIDHVFGCPTVAGDLLHAGVNHVGIKITLTTGIISCNDGDEIEFDEHEFIVHDMTIIGIHEEA